MASDQETLNVTRRRAHLAVRNILLNELGFTKESLREEIRKLVNEEVGRVLTERNLSERVAAMIDKLIAETARKSDLQKMVTQALRDQTKDQVAKLFDQQVRVSIEMRQEGGAW